MKKFAGGLITGAIVGAAMGMIIDPIGDKQHKKMRKTANGMFKTIGSVIDNVVDMW